MAHQVLVDGTMLVFRLSGVVTAADLEALATETLEIERGGTHTPPRLTDLRAVIDATIGYPEVASLADVTRARPLVGPIRSALLVAQPAQLGFARMFQTLNQHPLITIRIFDDETAAREWLAGDPNDAPEADS
jgi:hypothetical protein